MCFLSNEIWYFKIYISHAILSYQPNVIYMTKMRWVMTVYEGVLTPKKHINFKCQSYQCRR